MNGACGFKRGGCGRPFFFWTRRNAGDPPVLSLSEGEGKGEGQLYRKRWGLTLKGVSRPPARHFLSLSGVPSRQSAFSASDNAAANTGERPASP
jgi:hypothetical protein